MQHIPKHSHQIDLNTFIEEDHSHKFYLKRTTFSRNENYVPRPSALWDSCFTGYQRAIPSLISSQSKSTGDHSHKFSGKTEPNIPDVPLAIDNRQPYYVVVYIIYTAPALRKIENLEDEKSLENRFTAPKVFHVLPRNTILMIADDIHEYFNVKGKGLAHYIG